MDDHTYSNPVVTQKRKRSQAALERDRVRQKTRVNIGIAFERWMYLKDEKGLLSHAEVASFLLNSYEQASKRHTSTPRKMTGPRVENMPSLSSIEGSSGTDRECPKRLAKSQLSEEMDSLAQSLHEVSIAEKPEDANEDQQDVVEDEFNSLQNSVIDWAEKESKTQQDDSSDDEYHPPISLRFGGALKNPQPLPIDQLELIGVDETVHDLPPLPESSTDVPLSGLAEAAGTVKVTKEEDIIGVRAAVVFENCLKQLVSYLNLPIKRCSGYEGGFACDCVFPFDTNITTRGTAIKVEWVCLKGHRVWSWNSQPLLKFGLQAGDFQLATNILLSGNNYTKISLLLKFMNMGTVNRNTFFTIQDTYCVDSIKEFWNARRSEEIARLVGKDIVLLGDARNDSPGHSAQYCSYTTMENETKGIVNVVTIDKRQTNWNSNVMEKEAFIQTIGTLSKELRVVEICTDAHVQIGALMNPEKGMFKDLGIKHSLDMWHGAKNLAKKIAAAGKLRGQSQLLHWLKDIVNHFWWCCKTAATLDDFMTLWTGLLHHVCGDHTWATGSCQHGDLEEESQRQWIERDSACHKALVDIVLNKRWLKDMAKYLHFRSTADLEGFQNHILMYASKRYAFTPPVYEARVLLAALDYNYHRDRPTMTTSEGKKIYRKVYHKNARRYSLYALRAEKSYGYIPELQKSILQSRLASDCGMPRRRSVRVGDPRRLGVVPPLPPPSTEELLRSHVSRGLGTEPGTDL